ncbi:MAG: 2-amino-4-hydroxy-6-hydroxymethyldihydropteridine diphosphokinase [Pseudomonadota bacterium]
MEDQALEANQSHRCVIIAVGSNVSDHISDAKTVVLHAIEKLDTFGTVQVSSPLYKTPCFPAGAGPDFVNAAVVVQCEWAALTVLDHLHKIEADFGRERNARWGQRSLDLDLIAQGDLVLPDRATFEHWRHLPLDQQVKESPTGLILPHPRLQDRAFVLGPLVDIAADWRHPVLNRTIRQMWDALPPADQASLTPL